MQQLCRSGSSSSLISVSCPSPRLSKSLRLPQIMATSEEVGCSCSKWHYWNFCRWKGRTRPRAFQTCPNRHVHQPQDLICQEELPSFIFIIVPPAINLRLKPSQQHKPPPLHLEGNAHSVGWIDLSANSAEGRRQLINSFSPLQGGGEFPSGRNAST